MDALLYAAVSRAEVHQTLCTASLASWPSMRAVFEDLLRRYPHVDHRNLDACLACMADDRPVLQEQLALIGDPYRSGFWGDSPERTFEACKKVAQAIWPRGHLLR